MNVIIASLKGCSKCKLLQMDLQSLDIPYHVRYFEDHPSLAEEYKNMRSPVLIADGALVFVGLPRHEVLRSFFDHYASVAVAT